jgi:multidrug efflux pump subunit AcrA (membrane-fusion protein)
MNAAQLKMQSTMDIPRAPKRRTRPQLIVAAAALVIVVAITVGVRRLSAAAPPVDRSSVWIETVARGPMLRSVQGQGSLVPEEIRWISALANGRVDRIRMRAGARVQPDTVLLDLANPDVELAALEADRQVAADMSQWDHVDRIQLR